MTASVAELAITEKRSLPPVIDRQVAELAIRRATQLGLGLTAPDADQISDLLRVAPNQVTAPRVCMLPGEAFDVLPSAYEGVPTELGDFTPRIARQVARLTPGEIDVNLVHGLASLFINIMSERGPELGERGVWNIIGVSLDDPENAVAVSLPVGVSVEKVQKLDLAELGIVGAIMNDVHAQTTRLLVETKEK